MLVEAVGVGPALAAGGVEPASVFGGAGCLWRVVEGASACLDGSGL